MMTGSAYKLLLEPLKDAVTSKLIIKDSVGGNRLDEITRSCNFIYGTQNVNGVPTRSIVLENPINSLAGEYSDTTTDARYAYQEFYNNAGDVLLFTLDYTVGNDLNQILDYQIHSLTEFEIWFTDQ